MYTYSIHRGARVCASNISGKVISIDIRACATQVDVIIGRGERESLEKFAHKNTPGIYGQSLRNFSVIVRDVASSLPSFLVCVRFRPVLSLSTFSCNLADERTRIRE